MRKKLVGLVFALLMLFMLVPAETTYAADYISSDGQWMYYGNTIEKYIGNDASVTIPAVIDGKQMDTIGSKCFEENYGITSVTISQNDKYSVYGYAWDISSNAFYNCMNLQEIRILDNSIDPSSDFATYCADNLVIKCYTKNNCWSSFYNWGYK